MKKECLTLLLFVVAYSAISQNAPIYPLKNNVLHPDSIAATRSAMSSATGGVDIQAPNIIPPSPQSQIFDKVFIDHPVTEYYGLPEISIPLGEISIKGVTIPILLVYHAGGVKYMQYDGEVAAGWSINVGGYRISRTIYGKSDFDYPNRVKLSDPEYTYLDQSYYDSSYTYWQRKWLRDQYLARIACIPNWRGNLSQYTLGPILIEGMMSNSMSEWLKDGEYDQFTFNTPTTNGHFVLGDRGFSSNFYVGSVLEGTGEKISINRDGAVITDNNGVKYDFGGGASSERSMMEPEVKFYETGWGLSRVTNPYGEKINFSYTQDTIPHHRTFGMYGSASFSPSAQACFPNAISEDLTIISPCSNVRLSKGGLDHYEGHPLSVRTPLIKKIETSDMIVVFNRTNTSDKSGNSRSLITSIEIKNRNSTFYKKIVFEQNKYPKNPVDGNMWHYLLDNITFEDINGNIEKSYYFDYHRKKSFPIGIPYPDQYGYYTFGGRKDVYLHKEFHEEKFLVEPTTFFANTHRNTVTGSFGERYGKSTNYLVDRSNSLQSDLFSLKSITYPTGGITEYQYAHNHYLDPQTYKKMTGGGIRIEFITTYESATDRSPIVMNYEYAIGIPSFPLGKDNFQTMTMTLGNVSYPSKYLEGCSSLTYRETKTFSMNPTGDIPMGDFKVSYPQVTVKKKRKNGNIFTSEGKILSTFHIPRQYITDYFAKGKNRLIEILDWPGLVHYQHRQPTASYQIKNSNISVKEYALGYQPYLLTRTIFNQTNDTVRFEKYSYLDTRGSLRDEPIYRGLKVSQKVYWGPDIHDTPFGYPSYTDVNVGLIMGKTAPYWDKHYAYYHIKSFFEFMPYEIRGGKYLPKDKLVKEYDLRGQNPITTFESFDYDVYLRLIKRTTVNSDSVLLVKNDNYVQADSRTLWIANMTNTILESYTTYDDTETSRVKYYYGKESKVPLYVQGSAAGVDNLKTYYRYQYDRQYNNIIGFEDKQNINTSIVWSYGNKYPVFVMNNLPSASVDATLGSEVINSLKQNINPDYETLRIYSETLKTAYPQALISIYTHIPGVGIKSITDPRGMITIYEYDSFGRLVKTKLKSSYDSPEILMEENMYNYRNK